MKFLSNKKNLVNKEIVMKKFLNKKVISVICILLVIASGFTIYKVKFAKSGKTTQSNVKYTTLKKTNISTTISSSGAIKSGDSTNVYSNFSYNVESIKVAVGDVVKKGDVLATIDTKTLEDEIAQSTQSVTANEEKAKLSLESAKQKYDNVQYLYDNNLNTEIINAQKALDKDKLDLDDKNKTYEYDKAMLANGAMSQDAVNKAQIECDNAKSACDKDTVALQAAKVTVNQNLAEAKTAYESAQATVADKSARLQLENKQAELKNREVVAPVDGTITNVNAVVGVQASGALFVIQDLNNLIVNASVDETDIAKIKVGQRVEITTDASGSDIIAGEVVSAEPVSSTASASTSTSSSSSSSKSSSSSTSTSNSTSSDVTFNVKVQLTGKNDNVKIGMNSVVNIITNEKNDIYSVPYGAVVKNKGQSSVYAAVKQGAQYIVKEIPITKGIESAANVEIEGADLSDGIIILSEPSNYSVGSNVTISDATISRKSNK
ncbi:efflux RND transporter periplasmic adaptor subunit [Clostridium uliginosum]|uniref:Multidrug resistance efflux pump n=1 Tax=Clostridium uliginosum TaxID=119641 RepID=A0A1I1NAJ5_9CLOT|nr:HlyD family efflux transporter periplasmic adaptor subunit [Clostridium uliginosum]SFC91793.1 Multidrug resistance efflux pump [Clostridium uliginosum]